MIVFLCSLTSTGWVGPHWLWYLSVCPTNWPACSGVASPLPLHKSAYRESQAKAKLQFRWICNLQKTIRCTSQLTESLEQKPNCNFAGYILVLCKRQSAAQVSLQRVSSKSQTAISLEMYPGNVTLQKQKLR